MPYPENYNLSCVYGHFLGLHKISGQFCNHGNLSHYLKCNFKSAEIHKAEHVVVLHWKHVHVLMTRHALKYLLSL